MILTARASSLCCRKYLQKETHEEVGSCRDICEGEDQQVQFNRLSPCRLFLFIMAFRPNVLLKKQVLQNILSWKNGTRKIKVQSSYVARYCAKLPFMKKPHTSWIVHTHDIRTILSVCFNGVFVKAIMLPFPKKKGFHKKHTFIASY